MCVKVRVTWVHHNNKWVRKWVSEWILVSHWQCVRLHVLMCAYAQICVLYVLYVCVCVLRLRSPSEWKQIGLVMGASLVLVKGETAVLCDCHTPHHCPSLLGLQSLTDFFHRYTPLLCLFFHSLILFLSFLSFLSFFFAPGKTKKEGVAIWIALILIIMLNG